MSIYLTICPRFNQNPRKGDASDEFLLCVRVCTYMIKGFAQFGNVYFAKLL